MSQSFGDAVWIDGGRRYTRETGGQIVAYDSVSGREEVLATAADLTPSGSRSPLSIDDYSWSADLSKLLMFTNSRRVWRQNTRGDYWVLDRKTHVLRKLGGDAPPSTLMFAKLSPDGQRVAYVRENNIYVEDVAGGPITPLTKDGGPDVINGTSDWVNEEELDIRDAFRWSPGGSHIAYWQFDTTGVGRFTLVNDTEGLYPSLKTFPYPKAGTRNSAVRIGIVRATGGPTTWVQTPGDPRDHYITRMQFLDANTVALIQATRSQTEAHLFLAAVGTGGVRDAFSERGAAWLDEIRGVSDPPVDPAFWFDRDRQFTWQSDKDGWSHVYAIARDGKNERLLTPFQGDVIELLTVSEKDDRVYFIASPENATQRYLYAAPLSRAGPPVRITPGGATGTHSYDIAPDGQFAFHTFSTANTPSRTELVSLPDHRVVRTLVDNAALARKLSDQHVSAIEFTQLSIDASTKADAYVIKPSNFDAARKYPVIVYVYGEVAAVTVTDRWLGSTGMFQRALADAGFIVVSIDPPGTPSPKGAPWRKNSYKAVNQMTAAHLAAALRSLAAERSYVDLQRVGIYGASGGGSNTLNALFREPATFKVGVAIAPVADQRLYDTIYQERYSGRPDADPESYDRTSAINFVDGLRGHLLLIHGSGDDNVHMQGSELLINRLVALGKQFELMIYPNRTHALAEGPGTTVHLWATIARYFVEHL